MEYLNKIPPISDPSFTPGRTSPYIAYVDECRAKYGSEIYPIDRFSEVFKVTDTSWAIKHAGPSVLGSNWVYLIEGPERAMLIDNGYGIGDLKGLCEQLVGGKEVLCAITHFHGDHSGGIYQWDEVHCHEFTADILERDIRLGKPAAMDRFTTEAGEPNENARKIFTKEDVNPRKPVKFIRYKNHDTIDLGGDRQIEVIHMGGHTPGLSCFLDKKERRLYTGDAIFEQLTEGLGIGIDLGRVSSGPMPHMECMDIRFYFKNLSALAERVDEFDTTGDGHGSCDSPAKVVTDLRDAVAAVLEDPHGYTKFVDSYFKGYIMQRGIANCRYTDPDTVLDALEPVQLDD